MKKNTFIVFNHTLAKKGIVKYFFYDTILTLTIIHKGVTEKMESRHEYKKALLIGSISVFSYIACYYMRNILSVSTPGMLETGLFTKEFVGTLSSLYMIAYAIGQLINGVVGDIVKPKMMVSGGLIISGLVSVLFAFTDIRSLQVACFILIGFSLSMLRGPLVKVISENTLPKYAQTCCVFFSFSGFAGPLIASLLAIIFNWKLTFIVSGLIAVLIGIAVYTVFTILENKKIITFGEKKKALGIKSVFEVFKLDRFVFFMFIGGLVEISASSIGFWIPTFFTDKLGYSKETANILFSAITVIKAVAPFLTLAVLKLFKDDELKMINVSFVVGTAFFAGMIFIQNPLINVALMLFARMAIGFASTILWSIYIPAQGKSGLVSTVNGVLDFSGYAIASVANIIFSYTMSSLGWNGIITMWMIMMLTGSLAAIIVKFKENKKINA